MYKYVRILSYITPKRAVLFSLIVVIYCVLFLVFYNFLRHGGILFDDNIINDLKVLLLNLIPILFVVICNGLVVFQPPKLKFTKKSVVWKIILDFFLSLVILLITNFGFLVTMRLITKSQMSVDWMGTILNNIIVFLCLESVYYIINSRESLKKEELARREAIQYKYDALKSQVNPHFLFNSLNILYSLVSVDTQKSKEYILSLSQMYRYIVSHQNVDTIPLSEELAFLRSYIEILEMRYHEQFFVDIIIIDQKAESKEIIPFTLQLLIENVTKHNIVSTQHPMKVSIIIDKDYVTISNYIRPRKSDSSTGIGLRYIAEHYRLYNKSFEYATQGDNFVAKIPYL